MDAAAVLAAPHVLVIDPHGDTRDMYAIGLESSGFRVSTGSDGADALEYARALQPAAVVMELSLPILDGLEVASLLKDDSSTQRIELVAVTGSGDFQRLRRALDAGFTSVLLKPCPPRELANELRRVLRVTCWPSPSFRVTQSSKPLSSRLRRGAIPDSEIPSADGLHLRDAAGAARRLDGGECPLCAKTHAVYEFRWNRSLWHRCIECGGVWRWALNGTERCR